MLSLSISPLRSGSQIPWKTISSLSPFSASFPQIHFSSLSTSFSYRFSLSTKYKYRFALSSSHLPSRFSSTSPSSTPSTSTSSPYSHTVLLPSTSFSVHYPSASTEHSLHPIIVTDLYSQQWTQRDTISPYIIHDGPPFANGNLHMGHFLNKIAKDIVGRSVVQRGGRVHFVVGWDCHGMPIEIKALERMKREEEEKEKEKKKESENEGINNNNKNNNNSNTLPSPSPLPSKSKSKSSSSASSPSSSVNRSDLSPLYIRQLASSFALSALHNQRETFRRWGILADWDHYYATFHPQYESSQLSVWREMVNKQFIYRGVKPVYWSPGSKTALAEAELEYSDNHISPSLFLTFPIHSLADNLAQKHGMKLGDYKDNLHAAVWTTQPWTLVGNHALAINPNIQYTVVKVGEEIINNDNNTATTTATTAEFTPSSSSPSPSSSSSSPPSPYSYTLPPPSPDHPLYLILAESLLSSLSTLLHRNLQPLLSFPGTDLLTTITHHPFSPRLSPILPADYVESTAGTGIVHTAPAHGMEDFTLCRHHGITHQMMINVVDDSGHFTAEAGDDVKGSFVLGSGNTIILNKLIRNGRILSISKFKHSYPYDWRTKTPIIIRMTPQWFATLDKITDTAISSLSNVSIIPESGRARLSGTVSSRNEWCLSRQRVWGVPIPAFYHKKDKDNILMNDETMKHIEHLVLQHGSDIWWKYNVKDLLPEKYHSVADEYEKGSDTMDVWFDSGCSWNSVVNQDHKLQEFYAKQNKNNNQNSPPSPIISDLYLEGSDQHRGWFQSSLLTSIATRSLPPYKTIITHGFVLDEKGRKMSKSIGNVIEPHDIIMGIEEEREKERERKEREDGGGKDKGMKGDKGKGKGAKNKENTNSSSSNLLSKIGKLPVDSLRLWVFSSDFTSWDISIGENVLLLTTEAYRKIRGTAKFLLGNLSDWEYQRDFICCSQWNEVNCHIGQLLLSYCHVVDKHYSSYSFHSIYSAFLTFLSRDLSSFYFDISKDILYTFPSNSRERREIQSVLFVILHIMMKSLSPAIPHTMEEVYRGLSEGNRKHINTMGSSESNATTSPPSSLFLTGWFPYPILSLLPSPSPLVENLRLLRTIILRSLALSRDQKYIGSSLDSTIIIYVKKGLSVMWRGRERMIEGMMMISKVEMREIEEREMGEWEKKGEVETDKEKEVVIVRCEWDEKGIAASSYSHSPSPPSFPFWVQVTPCEKLNDITFHKCPRCWKWTHTTHEKHICEKCGEAMETMGGKKGGLSG